MAHCELGRPGRGGLGDAGRQPGHGQHRGQLGQPIDEVVGVEAVGVEGEAGPRPPHAGEQPSEHQDAVGGEVVAEPDGQLGDD